MLETDAKTKTCPLMSNHEGRVLCDGRSCATWAEWTEPVWADPKDKGIVSRISGSKPKEPPQGHCGMEPPELNCSM
jgi:hypothetical protein